MRNLKEQSNGMFFVRLKEPNELRRSILETLKQTLELMQKLEKFKPIRHEKLEKINELRGLVKSTNKLFGSLKVKLPQTNLKAVVIRETQAQPKKVEQMKEKKEKSFKQKPQKKDMTEVEKLESELGAIESKLKNLG